MQLQETTPGGESPPIIPDHQLLRLIARGSYGEVWLGRNAIGAFRAIKIVFERTFRDRRPFERELAGVQRFEPVSRLHDGLMDVLQVGRNEEAGYFYCVMELADDASNGQVIQPETYVPHTLAREVARQKRLPLDKSLQVGIAIASALEFLHGQGLIHRDVKPSNIVFINGAPKLVDIGLVAEMSSARSYVGTEGFIPPEGPGTVQSDIYSFGKVLYEISTGKDRYDYPELPTLLDETTHDQQLLGLNGIILRACRSDPRERYQSAGQMLQDLRALQEGRPVISKPWEHPRFRLGARFLGSVVAIVLFFVLLGRLRHPPHLHGGSTSTPGPISAPSGLVSWWRGEGDARDSVGHNHGTLIGDVSFVPGKVGQGFLLNGSNSYIRIPHDPSLNLSNEFAIELWFRNYRMLQYNFGLIAKRGSEEAPVNFGVSIDPSGVSVLYDDPFVHDGDAPQTSCEVSKFLPLPEPLFWHHLAATYRQIEPNQVEVGTYMDGRVMKMRVMHGNLSNTLNNYPVTIGLNTEYGTRDIFEGVIDEISIYNRALTPGEILSIYQAGAQGKRIAGVPTAGLRESR